MKLISFAVPCYNSSEYMSKCIEKLALAGEEIEVLIIDDGSKDSTFEIAQNFEKKYPKIVRAIHQENKGHGGAVQTGIENSTGLYFKVIDSDDWAETNDVEKLIQVIKFNLNEKKNVDLYILNYVYERVYKNTSAPVKYKKYLPENKVFSWHEMKRFPVNKVFMMHSLIYKTEIIKNCGLKMPEHTYYVDNYFCYQPLPHCIDLYYLDLDFYHYLLGRPAQSCSDENLYKNYKMQMTVLDKVFGSYSYKEIKTFDKKLSHYMIHACRAMYLLMLIFNSGGKNNIKERKSDYEEIKDLLKKRDKTLYNKSRNCFYNILLRLRPWSIKRKFANLALKLRSKLSL